MKSLKFLISGALLLGHAAQAQVTINYAESLQKSIYFYEAQQAGQLPNWNRVEWRGDAVINDGQDVGVDLSGGWFDAGDHVKFGFPMAATATMLAWSVNTYPSAYVQSGQMTHIQNNLRFVADYFVNAHTAPNELYGQVGKGADDHAWWGSPEVVHLTSRAASNRPSYKIDASCPGSDLAGETAAALASISMVFANDDPAYSASLLSHARELYDFANTYRGKYSDCITDAQAFYNSWSGYNDELVWSALWLYQATGEEAYLSNARAAYNDLGTEPQTTTKSYRWTHAWDDKSYGSYVLMAKLTGELEYRQDAERWLDYWSTGYNGQRVPYTAGGLAQLDTWGANRYSANTSFIALIYSDYLAESQPGNTRIATYYDFAVSQMEYILGKNPNNIPYQIGMHPDGPKNPHHRGAHGTWADSLQFPEQSRHLLVGALVGGPGTGDAYADDRGDYIANEVATDYNAGFTGALARLYLDFGGQPIPESQFPAPEVRDLEYFVEAKVNSQGPRHIEIAARVNNRSAWPAANLSNATFRYFVDLTEEMALGYSASDISVSTAYSQATGISPLMAWGDPADNLYYVEVDFSGVDIFPGGQSDFKKEVQFRLSLPTTSNDPHWQNAGDPSWDNYGSAYKNASGIPLYNGATNVWGDEPSPACGGSSGINCAPTANDISVTTAFGEAVALTLDASDSDGTVAQYIVSAPASGVVSGTGAQRQYTPNAGFSGVDEFQYWVEDNQGAESNRATIQVTVEDAIIPSVQIVSPAANSEVQTGATFNVVISREHTSSVRVLVNGGEVASGVSGSQISVIAPAAAGQFLVEVVGQDAQGNDVGASDSVILNAVDAPVNTPPVAEFSSTTTVLTVNVDASSSSDIDGDTLTYSWDINGTAYSGVTASHTFALPGTYSVSLTVNDGLESDTVVNNVTVSEVSQPGVSCSFEIANSWNTGMVALIRLSNSGTEAVQGWEVSWELPGSMSVQNLWNANLSGSNPYTANALSWNSNIPANGSVEFGMQIQKPNGASDPTVVVTGNVCQ